VSRHLNRHLNSVGTVSVYYNEIDPFAAAWLRNLIAAGLIAPGDVDERSIVDVRADDLKGYTQCHFFAGIGGWSYALRLAGWPDDKPVWTGSCPCQSVSGSGKRKGHADERHLWPAFYGLIEKCAPAIIFGEQVTSGDGPEWLAGVRADLEAAGYACGAADLCAAGVAAPHPRQRIYWVANADGGNAGAEWQQRSGQQRQQQENGFSAEGLEHANGSRECGRPAEESRTSSESQSKVGQQNRKRFRVLAGGAGSAVTWLGDTESSRLQGQWSEYRPRGERHSGLVGLAMQAGVPEWNGPTIAVQCSDGSRRVSAEPDAFPLAHGVSGRLGRLRAYGNAIVPQVAAQFIIAAREAIDAA
jgi:DNA (cytosine-5)-methyltransferase 1